MPVGFVVLSAFGVQESIHVEEQQVILEPYYHATLFICMVLSAFLFFAWFWTHSGQTIGMMAWKIKVQNADGSPIGYRQSLIRFFLGSAFLALAVSALWWLLFTDGALAGNGGGIVRYLLITAGLILAFAGHWFMLFSSARETLQDQLSQSRVIRVPL
jgi:uncharacterized RDD family membrane protein YckC